MNFIVTDADPCVLGPDVDVDVDIGCCVDVSVDCVLGPDEDEEVGCCDTLSVVVELGPDVGCCVAVLVVCVFGPDVDVDSVGAAVVSISQLSVTFFIIVKMCLILELSCCSKLTSAVFNSFAIASLDNTKLLFKYVANCKQNKH